MWVVDKNPEYSNSWYVGYSEIGNKHSQNSNDSQNFLFAENGNRLFKESQEKIFLYYQIFRKKIGKGRRNNQHIEKIGKNDQFFRGNGQSLKKGKTMRKNL